MARVWNLRDDSRTCSGCSVGAPGASLAGGEGTGVRGRENEGCWLRSEHFMHLPPLQRAADVEVSNGQLDPLACFSLLTVVVPF